MILTYPGPALVSNTYENGKHSQSKVVEVGDAKIGSFPGTTTDVGLRTLKSSFTARVSAFHDVSSFIVETRVV